MKKVITWNNNPVEIDTEDRLVLIDDHGYLTALLYMPGLPTTVMINLTGPHPVWSWNGNKVAPTISPSILTQLPWGPERKTICNHVFIRGGRIQYLSDCTHEYAGITMDLPRLCDWLEDLRLWAE